MRANPSNEKEVSYRHRGRAWSEVKSVLVMQDVSAQRVAVSSTDWLDGSRGFSVIAF